MKCPVIDDWRKPLPHVGSFLPAPLGWRETSGILLINTANIVITALFSIAYEGQGAHRLGVVLTAG